MCCGSGLSLGCGSLLGRSGSLFGCVLALCGIFGSSSCGSGSLFSTFGLEGFRTFFLDLLLFFEAGLHGSLFVTADFAGLGRDFAGLLLDPFVELGLGGFGGKRPNLPAGRKGAGIGMSVIVGLAVLAWGATGFYIVPEGQSGIVTTFGRYAETTAAGFRWHLPMPIQDVQIVDVSSVRTTEIGFAGRSDRLREALMLTDDENIVDVQFTVQYRIKPGDGARDYVFRIRQPDLTVTQAAESAMREVVGRKAMDSVLFESKAEIAEAVKKSMQDMLDRYSSGIEVMSVAIQNAQPPQQVQAAFNDAVKAGQDRERSINLGEAYRNAVIPKAEGTAARLKEEALGYQARIVETARGDADRFSALQSQYARAPEVTRDRLYVDTVRDVMKNVTKVYVDAKGGNNLLYLPLDKIVNNTKSDAMTQAQKDAAALADHGVTAAQSAVETTGSAQPTTSSAAPGDEYQRMLRDRR